jgi:hypothetical protein
MFYLIKTIVYIFRKYSEKPEKNNIESFSITKTL